MDDKVKTLRDWIAASDNIVFFGGAGVSTESGIPDFRSVDGLYNQQWDYPPETILSATFFPVSYTHLDVYKRQVLHRAPTLCPSPIIRRTVAGELSISSAVRKKVALMP